MAAPQIFPPGKTGQALDHLFSFSALKGGSIWELPNLISAMWLGAAAVSGNFGMPTVVGFITHEATSIIMGVVALPFAIGLERRGTFLACIAYAIASYPVAVSGVISWANPEMYRRAPMPLMTTGHLIYGLVLGWEFWRWINRPGSRWE